MYTIDRIKEEIVSAINAVLKIDFVAPENLVFPPQKEMGDLSLACFVLAKHLGKNPAEIAEFLVQNIETKGALAGVSSAGPYFNIKLDKSFLAKSLIEEIERMGNEYGRNKNGEGKKIMIEFSNVNTHKEYHAGHLRNLCYGDAVNRIVRANGNESIPVSYVNDFGIHVAKTLWALVNFYLNGKLNDDIETDLAMVPAGENKGAFLGEVYVVASREMKENKTAKQMVEVIMKKIESREGLEYELWQKTREWSTRQFAEIYREMGIEFKKTFYENEYIDQGRALIPELIEKGILKKSEGAVIADLEKYDLGVLVVLRADGTATYPVADLALADAKFKAFDPDASVYVVDIRQALYFKQLFKILKLMGHEQAMIHLGYDVVRLPEGMMSSRLGNVITYEYLKNKMILRAQKETGDRHPEWAPEKIEEIARKIAFGAIKFEMLKVSQDQPITFDIEKALSFSGFTAAYLQYTYARLQSIFRKADEKERGEKEIDYTKLKEAKEHALILKLSQYPATVKQSGKDFNPSELARYLFELAQDFNDYYHEITILKAGVETRFARLALSLAVSRTLENGLDLLGIEVIKEM